ncbi:hypothetical protein L226DRAFT_558240 [Lentinus tigrinus ALCF2SS1-7]|uniref:uncharacterized protein n=1 Tax=Lentinus tigrinus ALCF2SS1-7 TaxID=1328758 RepID=UPI0011660FD2|nr:hypothetical protein L226DRAFT_558240 [Lentinus tigrinus ALCF2SS1-7]
MQFRIPKWYLLALLYAFLASTGRAASISSPRLTARGDDSDDDDDGDSGDDSDGDGDGNQHHRAGSSGNGNGTLTKHRISGGAIAGIVIGVLLLLVLLILGCWCLRRRRRARSEQAAVLAAAVSAPSMTETSKAPLLAQHPASLQPQSPIGTSPTGTIAGDMFFTGPTERQGGGTQEMRNIAPGALDMTPLPNPYDGDTPPHPPPRDEPPSPTSPGSSMSRYTSLNSPSLYSSNRQSTAPSAWTHDESGMALLSRGPTHASRVSTVSSLHDELSGYQKRLEAHHRKEEEDAVRRQLGEGSGIPADPPPVYSPSEER